MSKELLTRDLVSKESTWDLKELYKSDDEWNEDLKKINELANKIKGFEGSLGKSSDILFEAVSTLEEMCIRLCSAENYAMCLSDEDTGNTAHQSMRAKADNVCASVNAVISFMNPEILLISDNVLEKFYKEKPELERFRHYIAECRRLKEHTLSADMERLLALSSETCQASSDTFSLLNNADIHFPDIKDENGELTALSHGRFIGMLCSNDRNVRKAAFEGYYGEYKKLLNTYASLYSGQVKSLIFNARARKYKNTLEAAVIPNDVTPSVYENLIKAVNENLDALHSYVSLRKKLLNIGEIHMYDIYVPMLPDYDKKFTFEDAKELAIKALSPLGDDYLSVIKEGFENRWIDVYENKGKRSGAYETSAYGHHPFVLLNFDGKFDDCFTLVHEMGHAMHSYYSEEKNPYFESRYKIFVAEVASTCNELLLLNYLLNNTNDTNEKKYLLNHYLDMFKGTLFRQTQFAEFELLTNQMCEAGESLNKDVLSELYMKLNRKYYGPDIISDKEIAYEWARIPHFYYNFYTYQYATSFSASVAIVKNILSGDKEAVKKYRKFLESGCTKPPVELLKDVGVNLESTKPFNDAIDVMRTAVLQLSQM